MGTNRLALLALALTALEASTSERHDQIELSDLVRQSNLIALVEPASPPTKKTEISIAPKGGSKEKYPPFTRVQHRYVVKEVLKNQAGKLAQGAIIEIDVGDFDTRLTVHRRYYLEGVRKIPIYSYYTPLPAPDDGGSSDSIVFVQGSSQGWEFTASGAIEHVSQRASIEGLLAR